MFTTEKALSVLADISEVDEVRQDPDLRLYDLHILDSLKTVELMIAFSDEFGVEISPAELEREQWATPGRIVAFLVNRLSG